MSIGALDLVCCVLTAFLPPTHLSPLPGVVEDIDEPRQRAPRRQFSGVYAMERAYSSRAQDIIRKEAVIKTVSSSTATSSSFSTGQHISTVRFDDDVIDVSSSASSSNRICDRLRDHEDESDSDDGGFTTFGKSGIRKQRMGSVDVTAEENMATFVKRNPLLISDLDSDDDNTIMGVSNDLPSAHNETYSPHFFLRPRNFVDLDTAVL